MYPTSRVNKLAPMKDKNPSWAISLEAKLYVEHHYDSLSSSISSSRATITPVIQAKTPAIAMKTPAA